MKKMALLLALFMGIGQVAVLGYPEAVDNVLESKSKSELHPVADVAKITSVVNDGVNKAMETKPMTTVMKPVETVKKETLKGTYTITNKLWDVLTFRSLRSKDKAAE